MRAGIVGNRLIAQHVVPHQLTGKHSRDFLHDLSKLLENIPLAVRATTWYMPDDDLLCEIFSVTPIMSDGLVEIGTPHGLSARRI